MWPCSLIHSFIYSLIQGSGEERLQNFVYAKQALFHGVTCPALLLSYKDIYSYY